MSAPTSFVFESEIDLSDGAAFSAAVVGLFLDWKEPPDRVEVEPLSDGRVVLHAHGGTA